MVIENKKKVVILVVILIIFLVGSFLIFYFVGDSFEMRERAPEGLSREEAIEFLESHPEVLDPNREPDGLPTLVIQDPPSV